MGIPNSWMVYFKGNPSMDDDWGYLYGYLHDLSESPTKTKIPEIPEIPKKVSPWSAHPRWKRFAPPRSWPLAARHNWTRRRCAVAPVAAAPNALKAGDVKPEEKMTETMVNGNSRILK